MIEILLAVLAGVLTLAAPCILLPLPILLGASVGQRSRVRPLFITLGFVTTFAVLGLTLNFLVQSLGLSPNVLRNGAAVVLAVFGLSMIFPSLFERIMGRFSGLMDFANRVGQKAGKGNVGGFLVGAIIGIVWAPCAGPVLGSVLTLVAQQQDLARAGILLIAYSIGAGIPMLAVAYGGQALSTKVRAFAKYTARLQQIFGAIILLLAIAIYFQYDTFLQAKLLEVIPVLNPKF